MATVWIKLDVSGRDAEHAPAAVDTALDAGGLQETILAAAEVVGELEFAIESALVVDPSEVVSRPTPATDAVKWKARALIAEASAKRLGGALEELAAAAGGLASADTEDGDASTSLSKPLARARRALGVR